MGDGRLLRILVVLGLVALLVLTLWPSSPGSPATDPPADAALPASQVGLSSWPARGELASSRRILRQAEVAWRTAVGRPGIAAPGAEVEAVYLGQPDQQVVMLLRSVSTQGRLVVAAGWIDDEGEVAILEARAVDRDVPFLVLPTPDRLRVLAAPEVAATSALTLRRDDGVWSRVAIGEDGVSMALRSLERADPIIGTIGDVGVVRGVTTLLVASRASVLPMAAPVSLVAPRWGRSSAPTVQEHDAALYAAQALPATVGRTPRLAVLGSARVLGGRIVMVETEDTDDAGVAYHTVVPGPDGEPQLGGPPVVEGPLAATVVDRGAGRTWVLASAAPSVGRVVVRDPDGRQYVEALGSAAVLLAEPLPRQVEVVGTRIDGPIPRLRLPLAATAEPGGQ